MTAQIADTCLYLGETYSIAGFDGHGLFDPSEHKLRPVFVSTACWRGFHCSYEVADGWLRLAELQVGLPDGHRAPDVWGVAAAPCRSDAGTHAWKLTDARIPFTGGLVLGRDFIRELYEHMGFHPSFKYRVVHELVFDRGRLVRATDLSEEMEAKRQGMPKPPISEPIDVRAWFERCFSRWFRR